VGAGAWSSRAVLPLSRSDRRESMQRRGRGGGGGEGGLVELSCLAGVCRWESVRARVPSARGKWR
jgi:hypothetical protein